MISELLLQAIQQDFVNTFVAKDLIEIEQRIEGEQPLYDFISKQPSITLKDIFGPVRPEFPVKKILNSYGVLTSARSLIVEDANSGMTLLGRRSESVRPIGSVTKLMAAMVFLDTQPNLDSTVTMLSEDFVGGGRVYLRFNDPLSLRDVFEASVIGSDNTATQSLPRHAGISEEEFVSRMNQKAADLEMASAVFTDPTGIRPTNRASASDLVKLLRATEGYDVLTGLTVTAQTTVSQSSGYSTTIKNTNGLLVDPILAEFDSSIAVGKTGFLPEAGYVLASAVERGGEKIYVVVMGSESKERREVDTVQLFDWAFKTFEWPKL